MNTVIRWTEDQLLEEISGLDAMLNGSPQERDPGATVAKSYLKQLLKDRKDTLRLLQYRKSLGMTSLQAQAGY